MCDHCTCTRRRKAAILALTPVLMLGHPTLTGLSRDLHSLVIDGSSKAGIAISSDTAFAAEANASTADGAPVKWTCPMHPHYIADEFGACPICGMDLVKLDTGGDLGATSSEDRTAITVSPEVIQNMGVRLGKAEEVTFGRSVRSYGIVKANERLQTELTARVEGWVQDLEVRAVGDSVEKGQPLFKLYSPQLVISQNDYLRSRSSKDLAVGGLGQLRAFGVQEQALDEIRKQSKPMELVPFFAEQDGTVSELQLREGAYVKRGMLLARIQDYSSVWLLVGVAEKDLGFIAKDGVASVTFPNLPDRKITAKVDFIYPTIDDKTRTGQVRLVVDNADGLIRPGSYADVTIEVDAARRIAVPSEAILRNGQGQFVIVSLGGGRFQPKRIETELVNAGWSEIKSGVAAGDDIVVSGQFLLDSESALRESFRKLERLQLPLSLIKLDMTQFAMIDHMVDAALYLHEALVDGYDVEAKQLEPAISIRDLMWPRFKDTQLAFVLDDAAKALRIAQGAKSESEVRQALAELATALQPWLIDGAPEHYRERKVALMREAGGDRLWLQMTGKPSNPYGKASGEVVPYPEAKPEASDPSASAKGVAGGK